MEMLSNVEKCHILGGLQEILLKHQQKVSHLLHHGDYSGVRMHMSIISDICSIHEKVSKIPTTGGIG